MVFRVDYEIDVATGEREATYYATESVGIAVGLLISALHSAGLATLTHTPSPMRFLGEILDRPRSPRATAYRAPSPLLNLSCVGALIAPNTLE